MQFPELAPIKPINLPDLKPIGTDSVPKKQSLQEWHAAGGGVPKQYKGREHVWHAKVKKFAEGGEAHMGAGGVLKKMIKSATEAPTIIVPSRLSETKEAIRQKSGDYAARRLERAADEIPNLEKLYKEEAIRRAFTGDNAKAVATMKPQDFQKYAIEIQKQTSVGPKAAALARKGDISKGTVSTDEYIKHLQRVRGGFDDIPYLDLFKDEVGIPSKPRVAGHEGRHRNMAMAENEEPAGLVQVYTRGDLREGLPRRHQDEYINALREELDLSGNLVFPESRPMYGRPPIKFPDVYAKGGEVHMAGGGDPDPRGEMKAYDPTIRERMADALQRGLEGLGGNRYKSRRTAQTLMGGPSSNAPMNLGFADAVPFLGTALGVDEGARDLGEAYDAVKRGDYIDAVASTAGAAAGLIPGAAGTIKGAKAAGRKALAAGQASEQFAGRAVPKIMERGGLGASMLKGMSKGTVSPMDVYHGSPYKFDRFDASKIGTGEGAQVYGHGLYFAEAPEVAKGYQATLGHKGALDLEHEAIQRGIPLSREAQIELMRQSMRDMPAKITVKNLQNANIEARNLDPEKLAALVGDYKASKQGSLYKVDLPDEKIAEMLDWDKPVKNLPPHIKQKLDNWQWSQIEAEAAKRNMSPYDFEKEVSRTSRLPPTTGGGVSGDQYYSALTEYLGGRDKASKALQEMGIPGIKYYDEASRPMAGWEVGKSGNGTWMLKNHELSPNQWKEFPTEEGAKAAYNAIPDTGTRNFVTFPGEEKNLTILERNGQPMVAPSPKGMAKGGAVHMQKGGKSGALVSIAEAVAAASKKADEILAAQKTVNQKGALSKVRNESKAADEAMEAKRLALEAANPPIKASDAYGQHEGAYLKPIFYDRMKVDLSKRKFGGPGFSSIQLVDPNYANAAAGVTDQKMATRILNRNEALVPKGAKVIWTPSVGGLEQHKSNSTMFGEFAEIFANQRKNMSAEEIQKLSDKASSTVDNKGRLIFPNGIDLASRNFRQKVVTYPQRSLMADIFAGRNVGGEKGRTVPVEELLEKNLDPNMAGAGTLDLGNRLFRLEGNVMDRPDLHSDYRKILTGEDLNVNYLPVPIRNVYGDWEAQKKLDLLAQGKDRDVTQMDYTKNDPTVQLTDKLLTELQKRGYKEGGAVEKRFDGGGMAAADFAGPEDDGGSLDKAKIMSKLLADMAKEQGSKEADSLSKPRAATDLLNRGVIANNPLSAIVDMVNMGLVPLDILGSKLTGRDIKVSSDKPFLGSEHVKDLMNKYNVTSGEERPMMETALSFASPTGMIKGAQKTAELAKKAPEALSNVRGGLETLSADAQRPFRSATLTMEGVAPDLGQKGGDKFKDLVTKRMISGEGAPVGMERMGGRKTKKTTGQGLYENFAGQQETNPMVGVTIPRAGNLSTNKRLIADIGTAGRELGQEMVAAHKFTPLMFKNPKDATAMMIGGSERLTKDQIQNIAKALPGMIVTHSPKNNSMFVAPFEGDALDYKKASQTASEILGKGAKVQFGKADSNKDIMFRGDYDKMGARPSSAESTEMRNRLKKAEERIVRGPSVSQSGRQSQPSTLTSTVR